MAAGTLTNPNDAVTSNAAASALFSLAGTYAGGPVAFEASVDNGATFPFALAVTSAAGGSAVTALTLTANQAWAGFANSEGFSHVRVRATGAVGGVTATVVPTMTPLGGGGGGGSSGGGATAGSPPPATGTLALGTDGTNAQVLKLDTTGRQVVVGSVADGGAVGAQGNPVWVTGYDGSNMRAFRVTLDPGDGMSASNFFLQCLATQRLWNGAGYDRQRVPAVFKNVAAVAVTAGTPAPVWTPAAGKKFRLMGYALSLSVAGSVIFRDAAAEILRTPLMPAGNGQPSPPLGNGILSALANNVLNVDVTATGAVSGFVFGTEE